VSKLSGCKKNPQTEEADPPGFPEKGGIRLRPGPGRRGAGLALYDSQGPLPVEPQKALTGLGDFTSRAWTGGKMAIVRGADRGAMIEQGLKALGGMEAFIQKGDRVLVKVNAAFATPASLGATTHPETLAAVAKMCFQVGRGPGGGDRQPHQQSRQLL
jgi:hypothetical protein